MAGERLPASFKSLATDWYLPLLPELKAEIDQKRLAVLGIVGTQGSGKSTLAGLLQYIMSELYGLKIAALSLDDFYRTREERSQLAREIHPLLQTRGVPGTHDVDLAATTIDNLLHQRGEVAIPRFDKAADDRKPSVAWDRLSAPVDLIILEGWCVMAPAQEDSELAEPINELEQTEDTQALWRHYVNQQNRDVYPNLYQCIDKLIMLQAPNFDAVYKWRGRQEEKLRAKLAASGNADDNAEAKSKVMDEKQLRRFIQHYERLTRQSLKYLPARADIVFSLDEQQQIAARRDNQSHSA